MKTSVYVCDACGKKCWSKWPDEEAVAEVCDDCYQRLRGYQHRQ